MPHAATRGLAIALVTALVGCGGGSDPGAAADVPAPGANGAPAAGAPAPAAGTPAPGAPAPGGGAAGPAGGTGDGSSGAAAGSGTPGAGDGSAGVTAPTDAFVAETLQRLNAARATARQCGSDAMPAAPPVGWDTRLAQAAGSHSSWMQATDSFSHTGANGSSVADRITQAGYAWSTVGENIAAGQADIASVIGAWLASPGHCANIMRSAFVHVGMALVPGTSANRYRSYWTLVLARPR